MRKFLLLPVMTVVLIMGATLLKGQIFEQDDLRNVTLQLPSSHAAAMPDGTSVGLAPSGNAGIKASLAPQTKLPGDDAYAYCAASGSSAVPVGPFYFTLNSPMNAVSLANQTSLAFIAGASWVYGVWYGATYDANGNSALVTINTTTGTRTQVGNMSIGVTGLAYDWTSYTMYALSYNGSESKLYTVDLPSGATTLVGSCGGFLGICLACNQNGTLYTVDPTADQLVMINKTTAAATVIGPIGFNANYAQDMEFDNSDNTLYFASYHDSVGGELRTVNQQTGATTLVGAFNGNMEVTGFAIQNQPFISNPNDVGVESVIHPTSSYSLTASEPIIIRVRNYGTTPASNFAVSYVIDAGTLVTETMVGPLAPGSYLNHTFATTGDFSTPGMLYEIKAFTGLSNDQYPSNDTMWTQVTNLYGIYCAGGSDSCREYISSVHLANLTNSSACSADGYGNYTTLSASLVIGQTETITIGNGPPTYTNDKCGVWIDWNMNGDFTDELPLTVTGGIATFSASVTVPGFAIPGTTRMRIRITNGTVVNPCGIDPFGEVEDYSINVSGTPFSDDLAMSAFLEPVTGMNLPSNAQVKVKIFNNGTNIQNSFPVTYVLNNGTPVTENISIPITSGSFCDYTFVNTANLSNSGIYHFTVYTGLAGDQNHSNDTLDQDVECVGGAAIYDNGPFVTSIGTGYGGADESVLQSVLLNMNSLGSNHGLSNGFRIADEFVVPYLNMWTITGATFYAYQTGSTTTSTITSLNFRIWSGEPGTGTIVFGDVTTNRLSNTGFFNCYRVSETSLGTNQRPIMRDDCIFPAIVLGPGTYWIDWQTGGSTTLTGPWCPHITIPGQPSTGNAKVFTPSSSSWGNIVDNVALTPQGLPFKLYGSIFVSTDDLDLSFNLTVFPNPADALVQIRSEQDLIKRIIIYDCLGQEVAESWFSERNVSVNTSSLSNGIYFLRIDTDKGSVIKKVAVQ